MASTPHIKINPTKILIIQFKYLGDAVFITPALQALRTQFPSAELHILVDEAAAPLFKDTKWITSVWVLPRSRVRSKFLESWPTRTNICNTIFHCLRRLPSLAYTLRLNGNAGVTFFTRTISPESSTKYRARRT